jgi:hypothetical protein
MALLRKLEKLPKTFQARDVQSRLELTPRQAAQSLYYWHKQGYISALGKRLDVFVNHTSVPEHERLVLMINRLHPCTGRCDGDVYREYSWTTQYTGSWKFLVPGLTTDIIGYGNTPLLHRSNAWWNMMAPNVVRGGENPDVAQTHIAPHWLLAESLYSGSSDLWSPDVDDLDFDAIDEAVSDAQWYAAFSTVGAYYHIPVPPPGDSKQEWYDLARHQFVGRYGASAKSSPQVAMGRHLAPDAVDDVATTASQAGPDR